MASSKINSIDLGPIWVQSGLGNPDHIGLIGTQYTDLDTALVYTNVDGFNTWSALATSSIIPYDTYVSGMTFNNANYDLSLRRNDGVILTQNLGILASDMTVTGGTYNPTTGVATFTDNSGGTFNVSGFPTGFVDSYVTGGTYSNGTTTFTNSTGGTFTVSGYKTSDLVVTGGTYSNGNLLFTNNTGGTFNVSGLYTGSTDVFVTGGTYSNGTTTFRNTSGGTFNVSGYFTGTPNTVIGTGTAGQVSFWNGSNSQTGNSGLTWNGTYLSTTKSTKSIPASFNMNHYSHDSSVDVSFFGGNYFNNSGSLGRNNPNLTAWRFQGNSATSNQFGGLVLTMSNVAGVDNTVYNIVMNSAGNGFVTNFPSQRFIINSNSDNGVDSLQVNGSVFGTGLKINGNGYISDTLGIGTTTPISKVEVLSNSNTLITASSSDNNQFRGFAFGNGSTNNYGSITMQLNTGEMRLDSGFDAYGGYQTFYTKGVEQMRINELGNIGVGKPNPLTKLEVKGNIGIEAVDSTSRNSYLRLGTYIDGNYGTYIRSFSNYETTLSTQMALGVTNGGTRIDALFIDETGNVGIGTVNPTAKLDVESGVQTNIPDVASAGAYLKGTDVGVAFGQFGAENNYSSWMQSIRRSDNQFFNLSINPNGGSVGVGNSGSNAIGGYTNLIVGEALVNRTGLIKFKSTYNGGDGANIYQDVSSGSLFFDVNNAVNAMSVTTDGVISSRGVSNIHDNVNSADVIFTSSPLNSHNTVTTANVDAGGGLGFGFLETFRYQFSDYGMQRITYFTDVVKGKMYVRVLDAGVWSAWLEK